MKLTVDPKLIVRALVIIVCTFACFSLLGQFSKYVLGHRRLFGFVRAFDVDQEESYTNWFKSFQAFFAFGLLFIITLYKKAQHDPFRRHWAVLCGALLFVSMDEMAGFHEKLGVALRELLHLHGFLYFGWMLVAVLLLVIALLAYLRFFVALPPIFRWLFLLSGGIYVLGAAGMECIGGIISSTIGENNMIYVLETHVEESLQMAGMIVFIYALMRYIEEGLRLDKLEVYFGAKPRSH